MKDWRAKPGLKAGSAGKANASGFAKGREHAAEFQRTGRNKNGDQPIFSLVPGGVLSGVGLVRLQPH